MALTVVFLCTGNAARSVMAGAGFASRVPDATVVTAGTHVVDGLPMSIRTKAALDAVGLAAPRHRSRQITHLDLRAADVVVGLACEHVAWVRRTHPDVAARSATLRRLCRDMVPSAGTLPERVAAMGLDAVTLEAWEDVEDPAGGDTDTYVSCARIIDDLIETFAASVVAPIGDGGELPRGTGR